MLRSTASDVSSGPRSHANNVLEVREASRAYRANAPVPLVKWQSGAQLADDQNQTAEPQSWPGF